MRLFGKAKRAPPVSESIAKLNEAYELLHLREQHLATKIDKELQFAKQNASKNRHAAMLALKRKKQYEGQVRQVQVRNISV